MSLQGEVKDGDLIKGDERMLEHQGYGLVQLIHGDGKGKTTSAIGQAIRCAGSGRRVMIVFFDKGGETHYFERKVLDEILNIDYEVTGRDRIKESGGFDFSITQEDRDEARRGLEIAKSALLSGDYHLVVLDEINSTVALKMLDTHRVIDVIKNRKPDVEVILTGRNPVSELLEIADLISEVKMTKHYFYSGVKAREGLDY
ncbi:cob(I)yrinic acid a,c-diamide adenosyltransferase [Patescibacteria group bacterium]|nr:cob(I)yrinic acid a,c-diamide adenosyltransferase [Patescibacteria group bacterium]MCG2687995.1 cob(I)yrinic acid a,c-diamide adenosyltransferase [Candidatus Parcubacteria bacterium]